MRQPLAKLVLLRKPKILAVASTPLYRRVLRAFWTRKATVGFLTGASLAYFYRDNLAATYRQLTAEAKTQATVYGKQLEDGAKDVLKDVVVSTLRTQPVEAGGVEYLLTLLKDKQVIDQLLTTLLKAIKSESFIDQAKVLGKDVVKSATADKEVEEALTQLFVRIFKTPEIKTEAKELVVHVVEQEEVKENMIRLVQVAFADDRVVDAMRDMLTKSFYQLLSRPETAAHFQNLMLNVVKSLDDQKNNGPLNQLIQGIAVQEPPALPATAPIIPKIIPIIVPEVTPVEPAPVETPQEPAEKPAPEKPSSPGFLVWDVLVGPISIFSKLFFTDQSPDAAAAAVGKDPKPTF